MKSKYFSLRRHLVIGIVSATVLILGGVAFATYWALEHETDEIFKARLATSARVLEALITDQIEHRPPNDPISISLPASIETNSSATGDSSGHEYERKIAFQVWNDTGLLLAKSESAPAKPLSPFVEGSSNQKLDDEYWEVFALKSGGIWVLAAEHNEILDEKTHKLALAVLTPFLFGTLFLLIIVNALVHFNLTPLKNLAVKISSREPESLTPIYFDSTPIELKPVLDELNELMVRVNKAFKREQWFIDAAAHELRTPIAALQIHVQNALSAQTDSERKESMIAALEGLRRTTRLAEQLLAFSRVASATDDQKKSYLMLDVVCREIVRSFEKVFESKQQSVNIAVQGECVIQADLGKIERLIQNLLDNASKYGASPGVIQIDITTAPDKVELRVSNQGATIPDEEKSKIFEPYYRVLGQKSSGTGLGLAIVQQIAQQNNATVRVEDLKNGEGTAFVVQFPVAG